MTTATIISPAMSASPTYITINHFTRKSSFDPLLRGLKAALSLLSIIVLASLSAMADTTTQKQYRIAAILPLTGDSGPVGLACRNGIEFALESLPPEIRAKYEVVYEDDGLQPRQSIAALQKLLQGGKIDLLINFSSNTSKVLAPMAERNKIPFLAVAADMSVGMKKTYTFNFFDSPDQFGLIAVDAAQRRGISKFARATTIQDGALAYKEAFDRVAKGQPKAILDQEFQPDIRDFRAFLTKVRSKPEIDAFFLLLLPGQSGIFAKQARELGLHHPFFSIELFSVREEITASGGALIGSWFADVAEPQEFLDRYRARFENAPTFGATYGHDAMLLANAGLTKGIELHRFFAEVKDFKGAMGNISSYSKNGVRAFRFPIVIKEVTKEGFRRLDG